MGSFSWWHWLIVLLVVLLLFGGGKKIPELLKGLGTGIKGFKKAVRDDEEESLDSSSTAAPLASPAPKQASLEQAQAQQPQVVRVEVSTAPKKRGRPKGSTNKTESSKSTDSKKSAQSKAKKSSTKDSKATKATKSSKTAK